MAVPFVCVRALAAAAGQTDDAGGNDPHYPMRSAVRAGIAGSGAVLYAHEDHTLTIECAQPTLACAQGSVLSHPDFENPKTILKEWVFPSSFVRAIYGLGPRQHLHSVGFGYTVDLDRMPGLSRLVPLPGRVGVEVYGWHQDVEVVDPDSCIGGCTRDYGMGVGVRYEQFLSNLFGIFSAVRLYSPPVDDVWITFGPMVEIPLFNTANVSVLPGISFRPTSSPRFELKASLGFWKHRTEHFGIAADKGNHR